MPAPGALRDPGWPCPDGDESSATRAIASGEAWCWGYERQLCQDEHDRGDGLMPIYRKKINGRKVYWTRVSYKGLHTTRVCATREAAKDAEAELRDVLRKKAEQAEQAGQQPATVKALFEAYVSDLEARGKGPDTIGRAIVAATAVERVLPA